MDLDFRRLVGGKRGISTVVVALLLIAITVSASVLLYLFATGVTERLGTGGGDQLREQMILASYRWEGNPGTVSGVIKNVGTSTVDVGRADVFLRGVQVSGGLGGACAGAVLNPSETCAFQFSVPNGSWTSGAAYNLRIVMPTGSIMSFSIIQGQSG
jgi:flagellin-like protein